MKAAKAKKKSPARPKTPAAKKTAAHGKKAVKKTAKRKAPLRKKRKLVMAGKKDDDDKRKAGEIDTGTEPPSLDPSGGKPIKGPDPMATPPDTPLSPSEAARVDQGGKVDLSGSPGSAGEHVPVIELEETRDPDPKAPRDHKDKR
jgi:hypothetical protein